MYIYNHIHIDVYGLWLSVPEWESKHNGWEGVYMYNVYPYENE